MTTTRELHAIIEELELVDIGEAASYLGEDFESEEVRAETAMVTRSLDHHTRTDNYSIERK